MKLTIIPEDGYIAVDGEGFTGLDMTGVAENIHAVQFDGNEGWIEFKRNATPPQRIVTVHQFQAIINRHAALKAEQAALAANPFHGMTEAAAIAAAVVKKVAEVKQYAASLQQRQFEWDGILWDADDEAVKAIQAVLLECFFLQDIDPVPTPDPISGYWKSGQLNANGNPVMVPMSVAQFKQFYRALYASVSQIWGQREIKCATIEALPAMGWTAQQIIAYDITQGW